MAQAEPRWDNTILVAVVKDKSFNIHQHKITGHSAVFEAMFQEGHFVEGEQKRVEIVDTEPTIFELMIEFIYKGRLPEGVANKKNKVLGLLLLADKYQIESLKQTCDLLLKELVTFDDVLELLVVSDMTSAIQLKQHCIQLINSRPLKVMSSSVWKQFTKENNREALLAQLYEELVSDPNILDDDEEIPINYDEFNRYAEERFTAQMQLKSYCDYILFLLVLLVALVVFGTACYYTYLFLTIAPIWVLIVLFFVLPFISGHAGKQVYKHKGQF